MLMLFFAYGAMDASALYKLALVLSKYVVVLLITILIHFTVSKVQKPNKFLNRYVG